MATTTGMERQHELQARCYHPAGAYECFPEEGLQHSIVARFKVLVGRHPNRVAVKLGDDELTYLALDRAANGVANALLAEVGVREEPVPVIMGPDIHAVVALLGTLMAGKCYVPIDVTYPAARISHLIRDSRARVIVTNTQYLAIAENSLTSAMKVVKTDTATEDTAIDYPNVSVRSDSPAWISYTSGSTGQPKGVVETHSGLLRCIRNYTSFFHTSSQDRMVPLFAYGSSAWLHAVFTILLVGGRLCLYDVKSNGLTGVASFVNNEQVTICTLVPTVFRNVVETLGPEARFPSVRLIVLIGEGVYTTDMAGYKAHFSDDCILINRYGSSETGGVLFFYVDKQTAFTGRRVPIGYAVPDAEVTIVGEGGGRLGQREIGEIAVRSSYLSPGYWKTSDKTHDNFLPDPDGGDRRIFLTGDVGLEQDDGAIVHMGRNDFQVNIRGLRVEIDEVEIALRDQDQVKDAAVALRQDRRGDERLVAYVVPADGRVLSIGDLRGKLEQALPEYMVPAVFSIIEALPVVPNGKVDRRALPELGWDRPDVETTYRAPRTPTEKRLARIWSDVLALDEIGVDDRFLELGGDSLKAIQVVSRAVRLFDLELSLGKMLAAATVADMALVVVDALVWESPPEDMVGLLERLEGGTEEAGR